jgi:hypothetical protein
LSAVSRDRLTKAGIWAGTLAAHLLVFVLIGMDSPAVRRMAERPPPPPPLDVVIYELPPRPEPVRQERRTDTPPEAEPLPARPREATPRPDPAPPVVSRPEPDRDPVRQAPPVPAPPKPQEAPRPVPPPQLKPREVAKEAPPAPMAPLPMVAVPKAAPARPGPGAPGQPAGSGGGSPLPDWGVKPGGDLRDAMRRSSVGCANASAVGLNKREREACTERLGAGAKDAPYIPPAIGRAKQDAFDAAAARKEADRKWKAAPMPAGIDPGASPGQITGLDKPK